jgi:tetratricopeptide (TPR) repeat protein
MSSRLAIFCDQLLEVCWLAALITAPLFFDVYSSRVFEPDKIALVRSLALVMAGAWLIKFTSGGLGGWSLRSWLGENPLSLATLAVVATNLLATIFSVAPSISLWGSYQRLQGLYTSLSYIMIFFIAASTLRTRAQFDRAINTAIVVGFPIAYYGLLQHYKLDTLPWGGDVVVRVASNMGNSIFVAAYLIMVVPLALARWIETLGKLAQGTTRWVVILLSFSLIGLSALWAVDFTFGWALASAIVLALLAFALIAKINVRNALIAAVYTIVLAVLFVAIFFTQSRGPWLGLAGGMFSFALLYALVRGTRRFVFGSIALAIVGVLFLTAFNLPTSPLDPLKQVPYVGRLGRLLETESGTGKVRELIWQGAVQLILPHGPLWSPTAGDDPFNVARPLIGYGPEAMYVAYNPFYPPDLGHIESRNASPDRSHNETFDSLVMTGMLGFAAYIFLFISIFYFGLKSLGMIQSSGQRITFMALWLGGGFVSAIGFGLWRGWNFVGVALTFGMVVGFFLFLVLDALVSPASASSINGESSEAKGIRVKPETGLWIAALLAAFIAHFIEINFGIAIVSTRTYFWFYAALLVVLGMNRLIEPSTVRVVNAQQQTQAVPQAALPKPDTRLSRRQRRARSAQPKVRTSTDGSLANSLAWTFITSLVILTLVFEFVNNQGAANNPTDALRNSLFTKDGNSSLAIFSMLVGTLILAGILGYDESLRGEARWLAIAIFVVLTFTVAMWFILLQTKWLIEAVGGNATEKFIYLLAWYYGWLFVLVFAAAYSLWTVAAQTSPIFSRSSVSVVFAPLAIIAVSILIYGTNYTTVVADIIYKTGTNFDGVGAWDRSIDAYERAFSLQANQDFYLLFMGRAYLEAARTVPDPNQRLKFLQTSEQRLLQARQINPLNTDHSANLARLNRIWATMTDAPADMAAHIQKSLDYYRDATRLSPNTAHLYNEWSQTYFLANDTTKALEMLQRSLQLDQQFAQTYHYLGDYYGSQHNDAQAVDYYLKAIAIDPGSLNGPDGVPTPAMMQLFVKPEVAPRVIDAYRAESIEHQDSAVPYMVIAEIYKRMGQNNRAREELERALKISPNDLGINLALVNLHSATGQIDAAINVMHHILEIVPPQNQDHARFQEFNASLLNLQSALAGVQKSPNDVNAHRTLAAMWKARGQAEFALPEYQTVARLAADDYDAAKNIALIDLALSKTDEAQGAISAAAFLAPDKEKPIWQNLQSALNNQKLRKYADATKDARARWRWQAMPTNQ